MILDGRVVANFLKEKIASEVANLKEQNRVPVLAIVQLCEDDSLEIYFNTRKRIAAKLGIDIILIKMIGLSFKDVKLKLDELNKDENIWGIMIDEPLPIGFDIKEVIKLIDPSKDVEGLHRNMLGMSEINVPTAQAVTEVLNFYHIDVFNKKCVVLGSSQNVGLPIANNLRLAGGNVVSCNKKTKNVPEISRDSELLVVAIGNKEFIDEQYLTDKMILIDVGVHYDENNNVCGDVKRECYSLVKDVCPSPGGIGPVTNYVLFENLLKLRK